MPNILWIWSLVRFQLVNVLIQTHPVKCVAWDPCQVRLALCCGNNKVYMWSPQGCISVEVPCEGKRERERIKLSKNEF